MYTRKPKLTILTVMGALAGCALAGAPAAVAAVPAVITGSASAVVRTSATVTGSVNPEAQETRYWYEYGPTEAYGQSEPASPGIEIGSGSTPEPAPFTLSPLTAGTTYHYRLVAQNETGVSYGADQTFTTLAYPPPVASTGAAGDITQSTATITGTIDPRESQSTYEFDLGEAPEDYSTHVYGVAFPGHGIQTVTLTLEDLQPSVTYHYRLIASSQGGTSTGENLTFTTQPASFPIAAPPTPPLLATPNIAFPGEPGAKPAVKKKTKSKPKKKPKKPKKASTTGQKTGHNHTRKKR